MNIDEAKIILSDAGYILEESVFTGLNSTIAARLRAFNNCYASAKSRGRLDTDAMTVVKFINGYASFIPDVPVRNRPWLRDRIDLLNGKLKALGRSQIIVDDDGKINGVLPKQPSMRSERNPRTNTVQQPKPVQSPAPKPVRKKYLVCYTTNTDHDSCKVWVYANNPEDAKAQAYSEYWDIDYIDFVREL